MGVGGHAEGEGERLGRGEVSVLSWPCSLCYRFPHGKLKYKPKDVDLEL